MSNYLKHVRSKLHYDPFPQVILDAIAKLGITIQPYYLFKEGLFDNNLPHLKTALTGYNFEFLGPEDMRIISAIPYRIFTEQQLVARLEEGKVCFAAKCDGRIAAFTWCNMHECHFKGHSFPLKEDEAYMFDTFTMPSFRGKGIAPYLRNRHYQELAESGKQTVYSISERFNIASIKFKRKLNAKIVGRGIYVEIFRRWGFRSKLIKM